jgi:hypothetical protein
MALKPLTDVVQGTVPIHPEHLRLLKDFAQRIPKTQHGLFFIKIESSPEYGEMIDHVLLNPNGAIKSMNALQGNASDIGLHDENRSISFTIKDIKNIIANTLISNQQISPQNYSEYVFPNKLTENAEAYYRSQGLDYKGTYLLQAALEMNGLDFVESQRLERIAKAIPQDVRDAFTVDFIEDNGSLRVQSLAIAPRVLKQVLAESGIQASIPHNTPKCAIEGDAFRNIADAIRIGRRIA